MNLSFWDGVLITSMLWALVVVIVYCIGVCAGLEQGADITNWGVGYNDGWRAAFEYMKGMRGDENT